MTTGVSFKAVKQPATNETVQFCLEIWKEAYARSLAEGKSGYFAGQDAHQAFREAMPDLIGSGDIHDFIACLGRGMLIGAVEPEIASKLLAAARLASQSIASAESNALKAAKLQAEAAA
jgi:hypothetical protein